VSTGPERLPALELDVAARARDLCTHVPGDPQMCSEGVAHVERVTHRDNLPSPVTPEAHHTDVRVSFRITAWLDDSRPER
jgi:hypothetical protein